MSDSESKGIPPGTYTRETLPQISEGARRIIERLRTRSRALDAPEHPEPDLVRKRSKTTEQVVGLRPTERLQPSVRNTLGERLRRLNP